ncbi:hypothetical protein DL98DRAFT_541520 [Cadophora sp. DSE1049]|nr:hypothetical protein DL98DRAFT_541520 [Cadophora sp. DSE1049]
MLTLEDSRIAADNTKRAAEAAAVAKAAASNPTDNPEMGDGSDDKGDGDYNPSSSGTNEKQEAKKDLGSLIYPNWSNNADAKEAFKIKTAAKNLGFKQIYIDQVDLWNGSNKFPEVEFSNEAFKTETAKPKKKPKGERIKPTNETAKPKDETAKPKDETAKPKDQTTEPGDAIKNIYKLVRPFLKLLLINDTDLKSVAALAFINKKIKAQN